FLMFGCIVAGRLIQTNLQQVGDGKYVFELPDAYTINHLVVFLLGTPFPAGYAATVHFLWPGQTVWSFLGMLSNDKPSAIFKLGGLKELKSSDMLTEDEIPKTAQLGISIEPIDQVMQQAGQSKPPVDLPMRLLEHFYNYLTSFSSQLPKDASVLFGANVNSWIPLKALSEWYDNVQRRIKQDPSFLKN
ncbi:C11orf73, partial [Gorgonomyces haynaldii]